VLQLKNNTRFAASMVVFPNEQAIDTLYVIVKASFNVGRGLTLADEQLPPQETDVYWTEPNRSSLKYASDMHIGKPTTDVVVIGHACAPAQKEVTELDVGVTVGPVDRALRVYGDRAWRDGKMTGPVPFKTMPIVYERAYGGVQVVDGEEADVDARNPVGRGFAASRKASDLNDVPLPNIEDPAKLIHEPGDRPPPAGFGFYAPNWQPRAGFAGTYDDTWRKTRAPYLPLDFDSRFLNMAHPDLICQNYLQGGEPVTIRHMHPNGPLQFDLPQVRLVARVNIAGGTESPPFNLETVILQPNQLKASVVWRAALPCDKRVLKISEVAIATAR